MKSNKSDAIAEDRTDMSKGNILIVDDNLNLLEVIRMRLESEDYRVTATGDEEQAIGSLKEQVFDLCIVDLMLANGDGLALMEDIRGINPDVPTIILTAHGSIESAVEAMRRGAYGYLTKPFEPTDLLMQIERALETRKLNSEIKRLKEILHERFDFANIIARSGKMRAVLDVVTRIATLDSTVHIHGESGTGKELIAAALHRHRHPDHRPWASGPSRTGCPSGRRGSPACRRTRSPGRSRRAARRSWRPPPARASSP